ncbi:MAG: hypothetical protein IKV90_06165 [Clostridia bacterium]|nr:hypothetical protein [Clostridia bacterium]
MRRILSVLMMLMMFSAIAVPAQAALTLDTAFVENGANRVISMIMAMPEEDENDDQMEAMMNANMLIQTRFPLAQYMMAMSRAQGGEAGISQTLRLYEDGKTASIAVLWQGEQADGTHGSSVQTLALDLETGEEIVFDMLFADPQAAAAELEAIVSDKIADSLSDYMEYADLLPMPLDCFSYDENGLTVYYPQERYLYFSGRSGAVHFAWHEIDHLIDENGPAYAISRPQPADASAVKAQAAEGKLPGAMAFGVGDLLGDALSALTLLSDPDYTRESLVYQFEEEALRGFALEIPKYAETPEEETPISAVRASRSELFGLVSGETLREEAVSLLGEPDQVQAYDGDRAADMMLVSGESLLYGMENHVLQLHFDTEGVLNTIILRSAMPDPLY